jgi:hypothetical protein
MILKNNFDKKYGSEFMEFNDYFQRLQIKPPHEVYFAFLDILGYSGFINNNDPKSAAVIYQSYVRCMVDFSLTETAEQLQPESSWLKDISDIEKALNLAPKLDNVTLKCVLTAVINCCLASSLL